MYGTVSYADLCEDDFALLSEIPITRAIASPESTEWMTAMANEVRSILIKNTWVLVDRSKASKVISSRFVLRNKYDTNGVLEKRKARIVAKGYAQKYGKDYHETYAPVARLASIRSAVAFAAQNGMHIRQYDVATAYLNGELNEEVYVELPDRIENVLDHIVNEDRVKDQSINKATAMLKELTTGDKVCHVKKALYGLKQAGRAWNRCLDRELRTMSAKPTNGDSCVYVKHQGEEPMIIIIYVDNILVMCRDPEEIARFGNKLASLFEITDLGRQTLSVDGLYMK